MPTAPFVSTRRARAVDPMSYALTTPTARYSRSRFFPQSTTEGEFSLFYFNGVLSHTILKLPKPADFRVQEEHGGIIRAVETDDALREAGDAALRAIGAVPLYARADFVRANDGSSYWLMELELIEPSLYLRMDKGAPERFARALHDRVSGVDMKL